jgi:hypothetical protein
VHASAMRRKGKAVEVEGRCRWSLVRLLSSSRSSKSLAGVWEETDLPLPTSPSSFPPSFHSRPAMPPVSTTDSGKVQSSVHVHLTGFGVRPPSPFLPFLVPLIPFSSHSPSETTLPTPPGRQYVPCPTLPSPPSALAQSTSPPPFFQFLTRLAPPSSLPFTLPCLPTRLPNLRRDRTPGGIKLEQRARKWGYEKKDVDGELAAIEQDSKRRGAAEERYKGVEEELRTQVDGEKVRDWVKKMGFQEIELSEDAGALPLFSLLPAASLS